MPLGIGLGECIGRSGCVLDRVRAKQEAQWNVFLAGKFQNDLRDLRRVCWLLTRVVTQHLGKGPTVCS